ncbi:hypothetical protein WS57_26800 [Burkholderia pseudomultivorans]|nr:hypothetical protein WS57_26800 [Burkholderia pseudomultivorans]
MARMAALVNRVPVLARRRRHMPACRRRASRGRAGLRRGLSFAEVESLGLGVSDAQCRRQHDGSQQHAFHEISACLEGNVFSPA